MDDSDMEILGIPVEKRNTDERCLGLAEVCDRTHRSSKKTVGDKLRETESHHHHTAASKSSHTRKKRRKSYAERNKEKASSERVKTRGTSEFQKHMKRAKEVTSSKKGKADHPLLSSSCTSNLPLITQNRITTCVGMYNKAKKSNKISRDVKIPDTIRDEARESLRNILDISEADIPPAPNPDMTFLLDDTRTAAIKESCPTPKIQFHRSQSSENPSSNLGQSGELVMECHGDAMCADNHQSHDQPSQHEHSPELSPVSEAAEMIHASLDLNTIFPGRGYFSEVKDGLLRQLQKQKQSSAMHTPRKSRLPTKHHSSVRKNLNLDFARRSGSVEPRMKSVERNVQRGDVVRRSDLVTKEVNLPQSSTTCRSGSSSQAPHTITAPKQEYVNLFEECALTLKHQPPVEANDFFPNVETQILPSGHPMDMLDYIHLSCSHNDSFTISDSHSIGDGIASQSGTHTFVGIDSTSSTHIYPRHLDPSLRLSRKSQALSHDDDLEGGVEYLRERYEHYSSSSEDSPRGRSFTLPPAPPLILPPSSPSPPTLFRQRMY